MYLDMFDDLFENIVPWEREGDASSKITVDDIPRATFGRLETLNANV